MIKHTCFFTSFVYNLTSQILYIPWTPMVFGNFLATKKHRPLIHDDPWLSRLHQLRRTDRGRCPAKSWEPSGWRIHPGRRGETNGGNGCHNFKKPSKWKTNQKISGLEHLRLKPWVVPIKHGGSWKLQPILRRMGYLRKQPAKLQKSTLSSKAIIGCLVIYWAQINMHNGFMFQSIDHP